MGRVGTTEAGARPVNGGSVAAFRIVFGLAMVSNNLWYLRNDHVYMYYVRPDFHFSYGPLTFIEALPGVGMYAVFWAMAAAGALIALGFWYRTAAAVYFVLTTYKFLIDTTFYQNHDYLISLLAFLLIFIPANRMWSIDALRHPSQASTTVPSWALWLLRLQLSVVYFFGGVAKLNTDWLQGEPLRAWLAGRPDLPLLGPHVTNEAVVWTMTYGSLLLDLLIVPFLLWRPTRLAAFVVAFGFHFMNAQLFGLVIFPWLMMTATTIYFRPDWPDYVWSHAWRRLPVLRRLFPVPPPLINTHPPPPATATPPPPTTALRPPPPPTPGSVSDNRRSPDAAPRRPRMRPILAAFLAAWAAVQVLVPLRHYALDGNPSWTEEGHRFAWHMKLRGKGGVAIFFVTRDDETWTVDPADHLDPFQSGRLASHPERLVHFARFLSDEHGGAEVRAHTRVSMNGRPYTPLVDPTVDLSEKSPFWLGHADWILDYDEPLPHH